MNRRPRADLTAHDWRLRYSTSGAGRRDGGLLHEFYVPALRRSVRYDRVAGYFRSSSLAAASRGFSALADREAARVRLLVGADLDPDDVEAVLDGREGRLADRLDGELDDRDIWTEGEVRGVDLLCWMVAQGKLEIRVAVRTHADTGEALSFDDTSDGYMHEKWAVFEDEAGHRLYASGSVNESRTAWVVNAENLTVACDWWSGPVAEEVTGAARDFQRAWDDESPHLAVYSLPDAIERKMIDIGRSVDRPREIDGTTAAVGHVSPPSARERLRFALIRDGPRLPGGRFVGLETAPVEPWPHQEIVARRLVRSWPASHLLCDEVGLGKTIEAGLVFRALHLSRLAQRILVAAPASLTEQWQREMASKFLLPFARLETGARDSHELIHPVEESRPAGDPYGPDLTIVSTGLFHYDPRVAELRRASDFDVALLDEAHKASRKNSPGGLDEPRQVQPDYTKLYRALEDVVRPKARALLLATATPVQLHPVEAWDLLRLTRRADAFLSDPSLMLRYYEVLGELVHDGSPSEDEWEFLRTAIRRCESMAPFQWRFIQDAVRDRRIRSAMDRWLERGVIPPRADRRRMRKLIFAGAPLSRVMLRHTRGLLRIYRERGELGANLAERTILPVPPINLSDDEKEAYRALEAYCSGLTEQMRRHMDRTPRSLGFYLSFLRLRLASSLFAITETLTRRRERVLRTLDHLEQDDALSAPETEALEEYLRSTEDEDPEGVEDSVLQDRTPADLRWEHQRLDEMLEHLEGLTGPSSKMKKLLRVLDQRRDYATGRVQQTVIFTRFYDTLTEVVRRIRDVQPDLLLGTYSGKGGQYLDPALGKLVGVDRDKVKQRFLRGEIDVLVCTDAAAEGLNLQTADLVINFDLPWNPMKVEQRIGRIDRIGQRHDEVHVLNLCYVDSAEQVVYERLLKRLKDASRVVGPLPFSLLPVDPEEFEQLSSGELDPVELEQRALDRMEDQERRRSSIEIPPEELYEIYRQLTVERDDPSPVRLEHLWTVFRESEHLKELGCRVQRPRGEGSSGEYLDLRPVPGMGRDAHVTASRTLYERGLPRTDDTLHFASYGDPVFDRVLEYFADFDLPACAERLRVEDEELGVERVGYAVACVDDAGEPDVALVTSWEDLEAVTLDEAGTVDERDRAQLERELSRSAGRTLPGGPRAIERVEDGNVRAGQAHDYYIHVLAHHLLTTWVRGAEGSEVQNFWKLLDQMDPEGRQEGARRISDVPVERLRPVEGGLFFEVDLPHMNPTTSIEAPGPLYESVVDVMCRAANGMKVRKSELSAEQVVHRLARRVRELGRAL